MGEYAITREKIAKNHTLYARIFLKRLVFPHFIVHVSVVRYTQRIPILYLAYRIFVICNQVFVFYRIVP